MSKIKISININILIIKFYENITNIDGYFYKNIGSIKISINIDISIIRFYKNIKNIGSIKIFHILII